MLGFKLIHYDTLQGTPDSSCINHANPVQLIIPHSWKIKINIHIYITFKAEPILIWQILHAFYINIQAKHAINKFNRR